MSIAPLACLNPECESGEVCVVTRCPCPENNEGGGCWHEERERYTECPDCDGLSYRLCTHCGEPATELDAENDPVCGCPGCAEERAAPAHSGTGAAA